MRWYNIVSAVLFILSLTYFSLAAPLLVQEKRQARVNVLHIPKDIITALGKRGGEELQGAMLDFFKTWGRPTDSSARPGPDHGSTRVVQVPGPNPAPSTANPGLLVGPSSSSSTAFSMKGVSGDAQPDNQRSQSHEGDNVFYDVPLDNPPSSTYGSDHGLTGAQWHGLPPKLPNSNPTPPTVSKFGINLLHPPPARPPGAPQNEIVQAHESQDVQQPNSGPSAAGTSSF